MILFLDTSDRITKISLFNNDLRKISEREINLEGALSERLLVEINELIQSTKFSEGKLESIVVNSGPGSYTGLRIGITTANFLGYSLNVPVYESGKKPRIKNLKDESGEIKFYSSVIPNYSKPPHITSPRIVL